MEETTAAFLAGMLTGRGGFDETEGRVWLYFSSLDYPIAAAAMKRWGGSITEKPQTNGRTRQYKWSVYDQEAQDALRALAPHLLGYKGDRAERLLERWDAPGKVGHPRIQIGVE